MQTLLTGNVTKLGAALASCALLAACATPEEKSVANPNHLTVTVADGNLTGSYNPAGFDSETVQQVLGNSCVGGKVATYSEAPGEDGLTSFTATCVGGTKETSGTVTLQRAVTEPAAETTTAPPA
ncbi:hypothetical protein [Paracoccus aestuariivivens]|uniref:Lipoprotein n=1 Tax=Paracoccus aestuariivivens TaxID=1820333 RepID=A0A6L6J4Q0_9RHOB|nr:hypothetical protein [Paracoccus aestuariivivens]MTH76218.1 hypothetical protein [Paracoccus aestuariivivens]